MHASQKEPPRESSRFKRTAASACPYSWFSVALFVFSLSYLLDLPSKVSRNVFYVLFAAPAVFFLLRNKNRIPRTANFPAVGAVFVFFAVAVTSEFFAREGAPWLLLKQSLYLAILYIGLSLGARSPSSIERFLTAFGIASLVYFLWPLYEWMRVYFSQGISARIQVYDLNVTRSSLLITFGILSLWLLKFEPWLADKKNKLLALASFLFVILAVGIVSIVFQSRSTLVALVLFLTLYGTMRKRYWEVALSSAVATLLIATTGLSQVFLERGISYRSAIWEDALVRIGSECSWLVGCGSGGTHLFAGQFVNPHSGYVATLYRHGSLATLALICLMMISFADGMRKKSPYFLLSTVGWGGGIASSTGFIDSPGPQWVYLWIPLFLAFVPASRK